MRVIIGLVKGALIGGGLGYAFVQLGSLGKHGLAHYLLYALIGAVVGLVAGRPLWRQETLWTPAIKAVFGVAVCIGLYAVVVELLGDPNLRAVGLTGRASAFPYLLGAVVGVVYGVFVEVDDGGKKDKDNASKGGNKPPS